MRLDGNFYKRETTELKPEISQRRKNIETYIIIRYGMNPAFAQQVSGILDKTKLNDRDIRTGIYDSVIELAVQQMTQQKISSLNDAKHIRKAEKKEPLYSQSTFNTQSQTLQQQNVQPTEEEKRKFEEQKANYMQMLEEQQIQSNDLRARIESRRGRK